MAVSLRIVKPVLEKEDESNFEENERLQNLSSEELLEISAKGSEEAFAVLYDRLSGPVLGIVTRVLKDRAQAEEVAQEVLLEVWKQASRFSQERGSALAWIMTIAHRRAVDRVRSAQAASNRDMAFGLKSVPQAFDSVTEAVEGKMERADVQKALSVLTDLQRETVRLAYYQGYTYKEVAQLLDVPIGTIKTRMRDGLIRLRDELESHR